MASASRQSSLRAARRLPSHAELFLLARCRSYERNSRCFRFLVEAHENASTPLRQRSSPAMPSHKNGLAPVREGARPAASSGNSCPKRAATLTLNNDSGGRMAGGCTTKSSGDGNRLPRGHVDVSNQGEVASAINPQTGRRFRTRCPHAKPRCAEIEPQHHGFVPETWQPGQGAGKGTPRSL